MNLTAIAPIEFPKLGIKLDPPIDFRLENGVGFNLYGLVIVIGLFLAVFYALKRRKEFGLLENDLLDGILGILPFSIICARAYYLIFSWKEFAGEPWWKVFAFWEGGIAIYGGVIGAALGIIVLCKVKKIKLGAVLDITSLGFLIGQSIGRWGNFFNREAFGSYCDNFLAMRVPSSFLPAAQRATEKGAELLAKATEGGYAGFIQVHPTFLYESIWNAVGFVGLHFLSKKRKYDGQVALSYLAWYGLGRTFIEGFRMDSLYWGPIRVSQMLAALTCFIAVAILVIQAFRYHNPADLFVNQSTDALEAEEERKKAAAENKKPFLAKLLKKDEAEEAVETVEETEETPDEEAEEEPAEESEEEPDFEIEVEEEE